MQSNTPFETETFEDLSVIEVEDRLAFATAARCTIGAASTDATV